MMELPDVIKTVIDPAMKLLPVGMDSREARIMLLSIGLQESGFRVRYQELDNGRKGPARGFWQFERGSRFSGGGVWGVYKHPDVKALFRKCCDARGLIDDPGLVWGMLEHDDIMACCVARLLLWSDPRNLPKPTDTWEAWDCYVRNWRPGKPRPSHWQEHHTKAMYAVGT